MSLDQDAFDDLVASGDPAMVIVTTVADGRRAGCLVGFHCQGGIDPPRYAVWLSQANHTHTVGADAEVFAVHWVPADRHDLAELFGGTTDDEAGDKLERCEWTEGPGGVPLLSACPDRFVGRRVAWLDADADHTCVVLEPIEATVADGPRSRLRLGDSADISAGHPADDG
jgi:flavin reductase (DIM6/NTAB) family NADH-FMN oxidoreductase RutF